MVDHTQSLAQRKCGLPSVDKVFDVSTLPSLPISRLVSCSDPPVHPGSNMSISSDEVNFLVYRYLQESGKPQSPSQGSAASRATIKGKTIFQLWGAAVA